ncbi:hypothetical protein GJU40_16760 [Bacillus lacus]|uniref:DoxX-like family protein n=1 Tax=Metabacillus lacus TaxID=1983721 RepID=A0A7X2J1R6_9BACI|nr:hypothetical protein [Metabacillus lacus]
MKVKPVYVEIHINKELDEVWEMSQDPEKHSQWDLRFHSITYLERKNEEQSFIYKTSILPWFTIAGWGVSKGTHHKEDGSKTSALHFGTDQKMSLIQEGKGYWRYLPRETGTVFLTQYDYQVRWGQGGKLLDRLFRPIIGWATALSFDVLKRWLEQGELPRSQYLRFFSCTLLTLLFFFVWLYQGLFPKILARHPEEAAMLEKLSPLTGYSAEQAVILAGVLEAAFALVWLLYPKKRYLFLLQITAFPILTAAALTAAPQAAFHPFNPVTFNASLWILSLIGWFLSKDLPTAGSCRRKRGEIYDNIRKSSG